MQVASRQQPLARFLYLPVDAQAEAQHLGVHLANMRLSRRKSPGVLREQMTVGLSFLTDSDCVIVATAVLSTLWL
jgi:hypothetical protein